MKREFVFFNLYDNPNFRQKTVEDMKRRRISLHSRTIRIEICDDGDGAGEYISKAEFVTEKSLEIEAAGNASVVNTMIADRNGEIEG